MPMDAVFNMRLLTFSTSLSVSCNNGVDLSRLILHRNFGHICRRATDKMEPPQDNLLLCESQINREIGIRRDITAITQKGFYSCEFFSIGHSLPSLG